MVIIRYAIKLKILYGTTRFCNTRTQDVQKKINIYFTIRDSARCSRLKFISSVRTW